LKNCIYIILLLSVFSCSNEKIIYKEIKSSESPSKEFIALILYEKNIGYRFAIKTINGTLNIIEKEFIPLGYHNPVIKLNWENGKKVKIIVDHDFGENNLFFEYSLDTIDFTEIN